MISTIYLFQLIAFYLWQITSGQARRDHRPVPALLRWLSQNKKPARLTASMLLLISLAGFILKTGLMSGICGFIIGLMGFGCLSVVLTPFGYLRLPGVISLYMFGVLLETLI